MSYQLYRNTTLGHTLQEGLDELLQCGQINNQLAVKVLLQFDKAINNALANRVKTRLTFKTFRSFCGLRFGANITGADYTIFLSEFHSLQAGHLKTYRFCDNVWTFVLKDVEFREVQELVKVEKVKIVACDGKGSTAKEEKE